MTPLIPQYFFNSENFAVLTYSPQGNETLLQDQDNLGTQKYHCDPKLFLITL